MLCSLLAADPGGEKSVEDLFPSRKQNSRDDFKVTAERCIIS